MRALTLFILLILLSVNLKAQNAKDFAELILQRYNELADGSYLQANKDKVLSKDSLTQFAAVAIIGANKAKFTRYRGIQEYELTFFRSNPQAVKSGKEILKAMKIIARKNGYQFVALDDDFVTLYKGYEEIMAYRHETYVDIYPNEYLHFTIYSHPPFKELLADEDSYHQQFPSKTTASTLPQVIKLTDSINRTVVINGTFKKGKLIKGCFRIKGYNNFIDGTWLSRAWDYEGLSQVVFVPEGTTDTIAGTINRLDFSTFDADYAIYFNLDLKVPKIASTSAPWLKTVYEPVYFERKAIAQKKYHDEHLLDNTVTYDQMLKNSEASRNQPSAQGISNTPSRTGSTYSSFTKCSLCNGVGYTLYDCGQGGGRPCRNYCNACNGTGQVHR